MHAGFSQMLSTVPVAIVTTMPAIRANRPFRRPGQSEIQRRQDRQSRQHRAGLKYYGAGCMSDSIYLSQGQSAGPHGIWATRDEEQEPAGVVLATKSRHSSPCTELAASMVQRTETRDLAEGNTLEKPFVSVRATNSISAARTSAQAQIAAETCAFTLGRNLSALNLALPDSINMADARLSGSLDITGDQKSTFTCSVDRLPIASSYHCRYGLQPVLFDHRGVKHFSSSIYHFYRGSGLSFAVRGDCVRMKITAVAFSGSQVWNDVAKNGSKR